MAHQSNRGIPLKGGMFLRHGQAIGTASTIANASTKSKHVIARDHEGCILAPRGDNIALSGAPKHTGIDGVYPGHRNRSGE
jgi:hypothetical protein